MALNPWGGHNVECHYNGVGNSQCDPLDPSVFESFLNDDDGALWPELVPSNFDGISSSSSPISHPCFNGQQQEQEGQGQGQYMDCHLRGMEFENHGIHDLQAQSYQLPDFASTTSFNGLHSPSPSSATQAGECNGIGKPRVRARRGQATDPHSIAERLRREKIADRMKNLQELLPNPNKTDKASMLDEIIEYVKFLQHQVKVLTKSRIGPAGTIEPLITDCQSEDGDEFLISSSAGDISDIMFPSSSEIAFEREVVNLMESNVNKAMQFLQTKGLCLMPVALASAMSSANGKENGAHRAPGMARNPDIMARPDQGNNNTSLTPTDFKPNI